MNIWMINHYAIPPSEAGGTRHFSHARELIRRGHRVEIIAAKSQSLSRGEPCDKPAKNWERELVEGEVPFNWIASPSYKGNSLGRIWNMLVFAQRVWSGSWSSGLPKPDVIIGSSPHPFAAFAGERLAAKYSVPFVLEVRDLWPNALVQVSGHSPHHPFVKLVGWLERYLYARASRIIMFSPSGAERVAETGNDPSKVTWVPNGIDLRMLPQPSPPSNHKCFTVLYLGAHGVANDLDSIVDAAAIICKSRFGSRIKFRFVGSGTEKSRLVARAAGEGIRNIEFDDPIPKSQVSRVLCEGDAFILAAPPIKIYAKWMGYNKMYDYLGAARPIVFSCDAVSSPVHQSGAGIVVPARNPALIAEAVINLSELDTEKRWEMGCRGRRYIEAHHNVAILAQQVEGMLQSVVSNVASRKCEQVASAIAH